MSEQRIRAKLASALADQRPLIPVRVEDVQALLAELEARRLRDASDSDILWALDLARDSVLASQRQHNAQNPGWIGDDPFAPTLYAIEKAIRRLRGIE